jgi:hypothetical protein
MIFDYYFDLISVIVIQFGLGIENLILLMKIIQFCVFHTRNFQTYVKNVGELVNEAPGAYLKKDWSKPFSILLPAILENSCKYKANTKLY